MDSPGSYRWRSEFGSDGRRRTEATPLCSPLTEHGSSESALFPRGKSMMTSSAAFTRSRCDSRRDGQCWTDAAFLGGCSRRSRSHQGVMRIRRGFISDTRRCRFYLAEAQSLRQQTVTDILQVSLQRSMDTTMWQRCVAVLIGSGCTRAAVDAESLSDRRVRRGRHSSICRFDSGSANWKS